MTARAGVAEAAVVLFRHHHEGLGACAVALASAGLLADPALTAEAYVEASCEVGHDILINDGDGGSYACPACANIALTVEVERLRAQVVVAQRDAYDTGRWCGECVPFVVMDPPCCYLATRSIEATP